MNIIINENYAKTNMFLSLMKTITKTITSFKKKQYAKELKL